MNVEQVVKVGLRTKEKGKVETGYSLKEQLKYSDPHTLISMWLENNGKDIDFVGNSISNSVISNELYKKIIHQICEDSSEIIASLENKVGAMETKLCDVNLKLKGAEKELMRSKNTLDAVSSIVKQSEEKNENIQKTIIKLSKVLNCNNPSLTKINHDEQTTDLINSELKQHFVAQSISQLSPADQILFEQFGQGPLEQVHYNAIHQAFEVHAVSQPYAIAAKHLDESITYQTLNRQANRLAELLKGLGVKRGDNVALFLQRSIPMLVGILATLKLGAAYVPQHVGVAPESQLKHVINTADTKVILTLEKFKNIIPVPEGHTCIAIDEIMQHSLSEETDKNPVSYVNNKDVCFILFTSGTTGKPNGVQVTHGNVCNIILTEPGGLGIQRGMKVAQILNIAFDMAAWEIFGCLTHGATLIIRSKDIQQAVQQADVVIATPSVLGSLDADSCRNVKIAAVAGEPCPKPLADKWASFCKFHNSCGPTETTIVNTVQHYHSESEQLTIGKPTPNNTVYILDKDMKPCAIGEVGEMWAGGECVTAGYLNNPQLNKERYAPDPFLGNGRMMFRTRDLGRWTKNGELEHFGRVDDQVKIRGFRVELDSVSAVLEKVPDCKHAVALKLDNRNLVAFVSPYTVDVEAAKQAVAESLPYYCTPAFIIAMDELPRTSRGKVDKRELLKIAQQHHKQDVELQSTEELHPVTSRETS
ncbi:amino acid adenylation domain-containing protein [Spartinivicinus poritis]|uniref:Amino acid adenylation domain-containing protein n=1 Tax=Spartinivicinus poritis TaxID=2994640 RepID=A0ABT5UD86_9GAMM|nr:amino acid adenylation domain-containing protein [Spartinivicinus sp. A2-2]MDE1464175.1 amino acid adenylation domain-containing protein [Spartinivicinus sp. A2-2]